MAMKHDRMNEDLAAWLEYLNYVFAAIFNIEMILKLIGMGGAYFKTTWNIFDFFIVIGTNVGIVMNLLEVDERFGQAASVVRGFRIMRIVRLIRASMHVRLIIDTLMHILP